MTIAVLTPEQIDALSLDQLNIEVAKALGLHVKHYRSGGHWLTTIVIPNGIDEVDFVGKFSLEELADRLPGYVRDISAAWELVEDIRQQDGLLVFSILGDKPGYAIAIQTRRGSGDAEADAAPEAIARAWLKARQFINSLPGVP